MLLRLDKVIGTEHKQYFLISDGKLDRQNSKTSMFQWIKFLHQLDWEKPLLMLWPTEWTKPLLC